MLFVKILLLTVLIVSQVYLTKFKFSAEGKDERGMQIQFKTNFVLYGILNAGVILLVLLQLTQVVSAVMLVDLLLLLSVATTIIGALIVFTMKRSPNY